MLGCEIEMSQQCHTFAPELRSHSLAQTTSLERKCLFFHSDVFEHSIPANLQRSRSLPSIFRIAQPESQEMTPGDNSLTGFQYDQNVHSLFPRCILEPISGMEDTQVIHILHIAFLEVQGSTMLLSQKMQCIQCFCLCLADGRDIA